MESTTRSIKARHAQDPETAYRVADDYLAMLGWMLLAFAWARTLRIATPQCEAETFYVEKRETGRFFFDYPLAAFAYRRSLVEAGCEATLPYV
ncbi:MULTISPECIES: acyl-CoA dehydrogenase C-terminal domain-containing protein [unclassified Paraburkholderia]|uniref:acyl-CoA dehydrogenase C-terminal domain-containing protein n=1 Tax=unclassified Paraburkholderia TaxID=2615204 RepID=UPI00288973BF|nr:MULTISPECIES: acyl-CoA dehydrogenase C-terminal domain-containing protein [unclassified Paraburkholderia]